MRIIHCVASLSSGGAERQLSYLAPLMAKIGMDVHVAFLTKGPMPPSTKQMLNVKLHQILHKSNYDPLIVWRFFLLFKALKPDIVHTWIPTIDVMAGTAAIIGQHKWIIREPTSHEAHTGWKAWLRQKLALKANYIIANSIGGKKYWENIAPSLPCTVIYNGLPENVFAEESTIVKQQRFRNPKIIFAGRLIKPKNIFLLLNAVRALQKKLQFQLIVCGTGILEQQVKNYINQHGLQNRVVLLGHVDQKRLLKLLRESALLVSPSFYEGCPNVVLEAMANMCPLAVSNIPAHKDILNEDVAFFFEPHDQQALERTLEFAINYPETAWKKALKARLLAENFAINKTVNSYITVYKNMVTS